MILFKLKPYSFSSEFGWSLQDWGKKCVWEFKC